MICLSIFDQPIERRHTNSFKWDALEQVYSLKDASDVLPMWVADMDFSTPEAVTQALHNYLDHSVFAITLLAKMRKIQLLTGSILVTDGTLKKNLLYSVMVSFQQWPMF